MTQKASQTAQKQGKDTIWGVDRYKTSIARGKLVAPVVLLHQEPGEYVNPEGLTGVLRHGQTVKVLKEREVKGRRYYLVEKTIRHKGKAYHQKGWVSAMLLLKRGKEELEREYSD